MQTVRTLLNEMSSAGFSGSTNAVNDGINIQADYQSPNLVGSKVEILKLSLRTNGGREIDLIPYYGGFVAEENLFAPSITGYVTINDTEGGLEKFAIHGGEILSIKVGRPDTKDILIWREDLVVHKVSRNDVIAAVGPNRFDLIFSSRSYVESLKTNIFKSFSKTGIAEAVVYLFKQMSKNDLFIEDPKITLEKPYIATGLSAHKAIDALAQRACAKDKYYVFFERFVPLFGNYSNGMPFTSSHYFGSVEKLISDAETEGIKTIHFMPKLNATIESKTIRASRYTRLENFNHLPGMMLGFYNSRIDVMNPLTHNYSRKKLSYANGEQETNDFYPNKLLATNNMFNIYNDAENQTPGRKVIMKSINDSVPREDWMTNHIYGQLSKTMMKIEVDIQGGTNGISVGNVVRFATPSAVSVQTNPTSAFPELDPIYSGKYLVTSTIHILRDDKYVKTLNMSRGSSPFNFDTGAVIPLGTEFDDLKEEYNRQVLGNKREP